MIEEVKLTDLAYLPSVKMELESHRLDRKVAVILTSVFGFLGLFFSSIGLVSFFGYGAIDAAYIFTALGEIMLIATMYSIRKTEEEFLKFIGAKKEPLSEERLREIIKSSKEMFKNEAQYLTRAEEQQREAGDQQKQEFLLRVRRLNFLIQESRLGIDPLGVRQTAPESSPDDF